MRCRRNQNLCARSACGIKRLKDGAEQVSECVSERFHQPSATIFLESIKVKSSELPRSHSDPVVQADLMHPERVEARTVLSHQIAGVSESPDLAAQVASRLPEPRGVKAKPLPLDHLVEIDVYRSKRSDFLLRSLVQRPGQRFHEAT